MGVSIGIAVGAVIGGTVAAIQSNGNFDAIWKGALVGAVGGAVGGWAAPALSGLAGAAPGALNAVGVIGAGMLGGAVSGLGSAALNGGTGDDYLRQGLIGAGVGGVTGGLMEASGANAYLSEAFGGAPANAQVAPAEGGMVTGTPYTTDVTGATTPLPDSLGSNVVPAGTGTEAVSGSVYPTTTTPTTTPIDATGSSVFSGGSGVENLGGGGIGTDFLGVTPTTPSSTFTLESLGSTGALQSQNALQNLGLGYSGEGSTPFPTQFTPNMSTPSNQFIGGGDYGITTNTGQVLDSSGNVLGNAPGWEAEGVPIIRGSADLPTSDSGWSMDKLFNWGTGKNTMKALAAGQLLSGGLKALSAGITAPETNKNKQQLMDLYNLQKQNYEKQMQMQEQSQAMNQGAFDMNRQAFETNMANQAANRAMLDEQRANAAQYNAQLSQSYTNPNAYLNTPEAQALRSQAMQKLLVQNAQAGRRTAGLALQNQLMEKQLAGLGAYRQGLNAAIRYPGYMGSVSGVSYAPQTQANATGMLGTLSSAQSYSPTADVLGGLNTMATPLTLSYLFS